MATHVSTTPKGFHGGWVTLLTTVTIVALVGVAFAAGRNTAPSTATPVSQSTLAPQVSHMMPWLQAHPGEIAWMQRHMADVAWMRHHYGQWKWMQADPSQWSWMTHHMGDIGYMHDHRGQWSGWRSGMMGSQGPYGSGGGTNGGWNGPGGHMGWAMGW